MAKKIKIKKSNSKDWKDKLWIIVAVVSMTVYIVWRIFFTIPDYKIYGWLATVCGILLVVSETISMLEGTEHFTRLGKKTTPDMPVVPHEWYPDVDILITTHNEPTDLLYKTVNGCKHIDYPDKKKVHIYICDDNNRPEMAELARKMGIGYFGLTENKHAKAGNLNNAIGKTKSPWLVTFDADMIPHHDFLMETIPYTFLPRMKKLKDGTWAERSEEEIDEKYKIGFIQTPQSFYNPDLFQYNFYSEQRIPNEQDYFFREINVGRNASNGAIYAGSNTLISRAALEEVGGIAVGTITEDFETGINIQASGYTCYAVDKTVAHGLSPTEIDSLIKQRTRWGRGCISSLRSVHLLTNPGLKFGTKVSYIACWMYWWTFFRRFIFIISPILFVLFGIPVVICSLWELILIWLPSYVLYNQALKLTSGKIRDKRWSNTVDTVIFPYMIIPILLETLFIKQKKFVVTKKTREVNHKSDLSLAIPQIILLAFDLLALLIATVGAIKSRSYGSAVVIYWLALNALHLIMAVFFMMGRKNLRTNDRFLVCLPVEVEYQDKKYYGSTIDVSETGMALVLDNAVYMPSENDEMKVYIKSDRYQAVMNAKCIHVIKKDDGWKYGVQITQLDEENKAEYYQIVYDRHHSLATAMSTSIGMIDDIFINIQSRTEKLANYKRKLPRVVLNTNLYTASEEAFFALDCNYEYLMIKADAALPEKMELLIPGSKFVLECEKSTIRAGLYHIRNWEELLFHEAFNILFSAAEGERKE